MQRYAAVANFSKNSFMHNFCKFHKFCIKLTFVASENAIDSQIEIMDEIL